MTLKELEARIRILEDIEAIRKLRATYCYLCDAGLDDVRNRDELISHFTQNARLDFGMGPASQYQGTEGLKTFFGEMVPLGVSFCMHMVHNPIIDVKGDRATGKWYFEAPVTNKLENNRAEWYTGTYHEEYVREKGEWKFDSIKVDWTYRTPYDEGWAKAPGV
jgi:hypothetical protein